MNWIPKKNAATPVAASRRAPVAPVQPQPPRDPARAEARVPSLEIPLVMSVRRLPAPVYGTLIQLGATNATLRSLVLMDIGTDVEFDLGVADGAQLTIAARVQTRRNALAGARFEYVIAFDPMTQAQLDQLARHVRDMERRTAQMRAAQKSLDALPTTDADRRGSYRALGSFPVLFRPGGSQLGWTEGRVGDISGTGIRMNCEQTLEIGAPLELRFTLPSKALDIYPETTATIDISAGRVHSRQDLRRPFEEMRLRARVVTRFQPVRDREVYGIAFVEIDGYLREEIARYTHAIQLSKLRSS
jgi:hypothetical protein